MFTYHNHIAAVQCPYIHHGHHGQEYKLPVEGDKKILRVSYSHEWSRRYTNWICYEYQSIILAQYLTAKSC